MVVVGYQMSRTTKEVKMGLTVNKKRHLVKIVTLDGSRFEGEVIKRDEKGFTMKVFGPFGRERIILIYHQAISLLEDEGWR